MRISRSVLATGLFLSTSGVAFADGGGLDVLLLPGPGGNVLTGAFDDDTESVVSLSERVFAAEFGDADPMQPNFADAPGFRALSDDAAALGAEWGFNLVDAVRVWNGSDFNTISSHNIFIEFGPSPTIFAPAVAGGFSPGFTIPIPPGGFDDHLDVFLDAPLDNSADGIYLLSLNVFTTSLDPSDTIWFVYNRGIDDMEFDEAIEYVENVIVPSPGAAAVLAGAFGLMGARRRRN